jgi:hypothetical protein
MPKSVDLVDREISNFIAVARLLEPGIFSFGQHVLRTDEFTGARDDHVAGDGNEVIEVAVFQIELAANVWKRFPPAKINAYADAIAEFAAEVSGRKDCGRYTEWGRLDTTAALR